MRCYAGIGSRKAPEDVVALCVKVAAARRRHGWVLRSGHAVGCDQAFERGAGSRCQIFLPWPEYNRETSTTGQAYHNPAPAARELVLAHHPAPQHLALAPTLLHARNSHIILGPTLDDPVAGVICWTEDETLGGTAFGLRLARHYEVPVHNLADPAIRARYEAVVD